LQCAILPSSCQEAYLEFEYLLKGNHGYTEDAIIRASTTEHVIVLGPAQVEAILRDAEACRNITLGREDGSELTIYDAGCRDFEWTGRRGSVSRLIRLCWSAGGGLHKDISRYDRLDCLNGGSTEWIEPNFYKMNVFGGIESCDDEETLWGLSSRTPCAEECECNDQNMDLRW
jgi:hypothetical protein